MTDAVQIRQANEQDVPLILAFIKELAEYEKLSHEVVATAEQVAEELFGSRAVIEAVLAYVDDRAVGFALYFHNFSTFLGRRGLYLEDLYVSPSARGKGVGKALLVHLARLAKQRNCGRFEWAVLNWNQSAINFYESLGAKPMNEWTVYRLSGEALEALTIAET
jgi:GNAT superfamily N-acetyltransferase